MNSEQLNIQLTNIFRDVFKRPELTLTQEMSANDVEGWDSLNHVVLIAAIEDAFGFKFKLKELMNIESVGDMMRCVGEKTARPKGT